jgi:hypothetical protein
MTMSEMPNLAPAVATSLAKWHDTIAKHDLSDLRSIINPEATFRSPIGFTAYHSADALILALTNVIEVFSDFTYHRQAATADGTSVVLEFSAKVGDKFVKGIDFIRFDADGKIIEFEVMMRPLNGTQALAAEMGKRVSGTLPSFKAKP